VDGTGSNLGRQPSLLYIFVSDFRQFPAIRDEGDIMVSRAESHVKIMHFYPA